MSNQFSANISPIQRSKGRSATAASAYRAGEKIIDERTGEVHDYSKKKDVLHSQIVLPGGAAAEDRTEFWNKVEHHHRRKDAVTAREMVVALPHELSTEERQKIAVAYAQELADRYGVGVDIALHDSRTLSEADLEANPDQHHIREKDGDSERIHNGNYHAHILMTGCHVDLEGNLGKKCVELDPISVQRENIKLEKEGKTTKLNAAEQERPRWCEIVNTAFENANLDVRWDHRSHEERGLETLPTQKLGPDASAMERKGKKTERGDQNREIRAHNAQVVELRKAREQLEKSLPTVQVGQEQSEDAQAYSQRRQSYKQQILSKAYKAKISDKLGERLSYVKKSEGVIDIRLRDGGRIIDRGDRLKATKSNGSEISAMIELAQAKGWSALNLTGSEDFRRSVWFEASAQGLKVTGYEPSKADQFALSRVLDQKQTRHQVKSEKKESTENNEQSKQKLPTDLGELLKLKAAVSKKCNTKVNAKWNGLKAEAREKVGEAKEEVERLHGNEPEAPGLWGRLKGEQATYERHYDKWESDLASAEEVLEEARQEFGQLERDAFKQAPAEVKEMIAQEAPELLEAIAAVHEVSRQERELQKQQRQERDQGKAWSRYSNGRSISDDDGMGF